MIRSFAVLLFLAGPLAADEPPVQEIISNAVTIASDRNAHLQDIVAFKGIATSQMQPNGTTPITFHDGSTQNVRLDFIGAYNNGTCDWALQIPGTTQFSFTKSLITQARLTEEGWPDEMIDTTDTFSAAECMARSALVLLDNPCMALLPIQEDEAIFHFAVGLPELCQ
ncbi:hypothetical protein [Octadecabacter ascidiaceicola]|uniref:Uncharacterized protein n=1 Tax=Octadecabacter ascidiaceicola TaxID=1655543 RepID=A0A238KL37_9RHOB|nr:hypothetical protein [Octadecabacter ascidiaceicola]SMX43468.1 hypothetical protein OCA8868_02966 [Octadecabacter ascidiaceicola]